MSGTKGNVVEEGTEPHIETTAASTTRRGVKRINVNLQENLFCMHMFSFKRKLSTYNYLVFFHANL